MDKWNSAGTTSKLTPCPHMRRCGTSFEVHVVSPQFEGKRLLERHKLVSPHAQDAHISQPVPCIRCDRLS